MASGGEQKEATSFSGTTSLDLRMVVSPYGATLAMTGEGRRKIRVFDLDTGKLRADLALPGRDQVELLFIDAAGKSLGAVTSDSRVKVWELAPTTGASADRAKSDLPK
jgi:WD40 repeat protein